MSYYSPGEYAHLYALRHDYAPGEGLQNKLGGLFKSGSVPDFLFHGTKEAYVDASLYTLDRLHHESMIAKEAIREKINRVYVFGGVALRVVRYGPVLELPEYSPNEKLRVSLLPASFDQAAFNQLESTLDVFPDMLPREEPSRHYIYAEFPLRLIGDLQGYVEKADKNPAFAEIENAMTPLQKAQEVLNADAKASVGTGLFAASVVGLSYIPKDRPYDALRPGWRTGRD